jgi:hypothetical protein
MKRGGPLQFVVCTLGLLDVRPMGRLHMCTTALCEGQGNPPVPWGQHCMWATCPMEGTGACRAWWPRQGRPRDLGNIGVDLPQQGLMCLMVGGSCATLLPCVNELVCPEDTVCRRQRSSASFSSPGLALGVPLLRLLRDPSVLEGRPHGFDLGEHGLRGLFPW